MNNTAIAVAWTGASGIQYGIRLLEELLLAWREETDNAKLPVGSVVEFLYEAPLQRRRDSRIGSKGTSLMTARSTFAR